MGREEVGGGGATSVGSFFPNFTSGGGIFS